MLSKPSFHQNVQYGEVVESNFVPPWWAKNRHVQTIFPRFLQKRAKLNYRQEKLTLPDGDFLNLIWAGRVENSIGLIVLFHGLEGSIKSHYINDMAANLVAQGYAVVLMHFRGCGGEVNLKTRAYHSGETEDAWYFLNCLEAQFPHIPKAAIGFSLGANMLLKLLSEQSQQKILKTAIAISVPFKLGQCSDSINQGFSKLYQGYLLKSMVKTLVLKMSKLDYTDELKVSESEIKKFKSFREFDQHVTAPLHGYVDACDYYKQCSSARYLHNIETPSLILHAKDDPFMLPSIVPQSADLSAYVALEVSEKGGHVGFMFGTPWRPKIWMHQRVNAFLQPFFTKQHPVNKSSL